MTNYTHGKPFRFSANSWRRSDSFESEDGPAADLLFASGPADNSPLYHHWEPGKYNGACSCCYLGFSHTEETHAANVARKES